MHPTSVLRSSTLAPLGAASVLAAVLVACGGGRDDLAVTTADAQLQSAWVEVGPQGATLARAITAAAECPRFALDGRVATLALRAPAGTIAQRTTASDPADSKPSAFPVTTCEATVPAGTNQLYVGGRLLALPKAEPLRVAILADTGCRMKKADNAWQACNDTAAWPFATIAATAASMKPDLVLHVGDYHYRENACPADMAGCKASPWGYGWDTWQADFFQPAAPLLAAAPWVFVRGNHEECARAGQGWARFLDVRGYSAQMACDLPANDNLPAGGNFSAPFAVALGAATQVIVFDSARAGTAPFGPADYKFPIYQEQFRQVATLTAAKGVTSIFTNHHPILAFAPIAGGPPAPGNQGLQAVMRTTQPAAYYPEGVKIALHGHVHDFQAISFASAHPATFVSGNGGDNVDVNLPDPLPPGATPAPGVVIDKIAHTNTFGFMMMERAAAGAPWVYKAYTRAGKLMTTCVPEGQKIACDRSGFIAP